MLKFFVVVAIFGRIAGAQTQIQPAIDSRAFQFAVTNGAGVSGDLSAAGSGKVLTFTKCPKGMLYLSAAPNYLYISGGTGTDEAAAITATSCAIAGGSAGTVTITTANTHSGSWTIRSATAGIQEAHNLLPPGGGTIWLPAGRVLVYARTTITKKGTTIRGHGAGNQGTAGDQSDTSDSLATRVTVAPGANVDAVFYALNSYAVNFHDFEIFGDRLNQSGGAGHGIYYHNTQAGVNFGFNTIRNISVTMPYGDGIRMINSGIMDRNVIDSVKIQGTGAGGMLLSGIGDTTIISPEIGGCTTHCLQIQADDLAILGGQLYFAGQYNLYITGSSNITVTGLVAPGSAGPGFVLINSSRVTIANSKFVNSRSAVQPYGIYLTGALKDIIFNGVHSYAGLGATTQQYGVYFDAAITGGPITFNGCNFRVRTGAAATDDGNVAGSYYNAGSFAEFTSTANNVGIDDHIPTRASVATLNLAETTANVGANTSLLETTVRVSGTTAITTINGGWVGRVVTLLFTDATPGGVNTGGNIYTAKTATQNASITLKYDGTGWIVL